ncbi:permease [Pikeienuella piscinae]|uniref:Permease n=1 Tax=Pikeienuella piscinae TaxID=2748098 RepID=A0A7L5BXG0_9RHOB|nr:permease [Pikeienuella piscinae]QIE57060.1 permease [Pikeienuella piscinae]
MTDISASLSGFRAGWRKIDRAWAAIPLGLLLIGLIAPEALRPVTTQMAESFISTLPFLLFAVLATAYLRAANAEGLVAKAFTGKPARMVVLAALVGGLSPFCSCQVIPFIAALLAMGAPLPAVMAFWLASPLMDPPMFAITTGALGLDFAIAKSIAAVGIGLFGGFGVMALARSAVFADPLRPDGMAGKSSCCSKKSPFGERPVWAFWREEGRAPIFRKSFVENGLFLGKWLLLAYLLEAAMLRWVPAEAIGGLLGGGGAGGLGSILLAATLGAPAYLNGYAAAPLAAGLIEQGMNPGAAMSFLIAGGVTCIPAAVAVYSLVRPRVFTAYFGFAVAGAVIAGLAYSALG